jgi:pimeloyl-ACP methyl ester carboxylesterase
MLSNLAKLAATVNVESLLPDVTVPTLVLAPVQSLITPIEEQVKIRRTIPEAKIAVVDGSWHEIYLDDPDTCILELLKFIGSL